MTLMTVAVAAALVLAALVLPHRLPLDRTEPGWAAGIWLSTLALRALAAAFAAVFVLLYLPATQLFELVSGWRLHTAVPYLTAHLGLDGHELGDAALLAPTVALMVSLVSVTFGLWRATRRVGRLIHSAIGPGPGESVILGDGEVVVAAAGIRRPRVVISAGALTAFDDAELAASLDHERGHIARRHRYAFLLAELCRGLGRFVPGTRAASREFAFHLERDADRFALARQHDPAALASAICKAAQSSLAPAPATALSGGSVTRRVRQLLDGSQTVSSTGIRAFALTLVALTLAAGGALPVAAHAGWHEAEADPAYHCLH